MGLYANLVHELRRWSRNPEYGGDPRGKVVVCFVNDHYGNPLQLVRLHGLRGLRFTSDPREQLCADVLVFHVPSLRRLPLYKPRGQLWVAWSLESVPNVRWLREPSLRARFDLHMTYETRAEVPLSYLSYFDPETLVERLRAPPVPKQPGRLVCSFISSDIHQSGRDQLVRVLDRCLELHSYGRFLQNRWLPPPDHGRPTKLAMLGRYRFTLAYENSIATDYVTEKFFDALYCGAVPVYLGAPNVDEHAPGEQCYIDARDFRSATRLAAHLQELAGDEQAYAAYFAWKHEPFRPAFLARVENERSPIFQRLARVLHERLEVA